ncbi:MAG: helix-turn-helix domain-containing protein [Clostridia bacterium]|nr:helix-turn-helix domain-containing protein [Clostridia bacterium]
MTLKIGEKIKELRKAQDITQDKLASYLNISYQAISKWENGTAFPDITLVPKIANFFGVSADYLLGIKADENEEKIKEYFDKAMKCSHTGDLKKGIAILREALDIYPNNCKLLSVLIGFLFGSFCANGEKELLQEIVVKSELVLQDSTDEEDRIDVLEKLAYSYNYLEMQDKAIETANRLPDSIVNRQQVLSNIIMPMDKRKEKQQECVFYNFEVMINHILWLGGISLGRKEYEKAISIYDRAITVIQNIGNEGFFLLKSAGAYNGLAMAYSSLGKVDEAYYNIENVIKCYVQFEKSLKQGRISYASPILDMLYFDRDNLHCNSTITEFEDWYRKMRNDYKNYFKAVIDDTRFKELCERIETTLNLIEG